LCDKRFENGSIKGDISSWVLPILKTWNAFPEMMKASSSFFATKKKAAGSLEVRPDENNTQEANLKLKRNKGIQFFGLGNGGLL